MASFLFKTEPSAYSYADLVRDKGTVWGGVTSPLALIHLRKVRTGDTIVIYHSGRERAAVGLATAASDPYPDPGSKNPRHVAVRLEPRRALRRPVPLLSFRSDPVLSRMELMRIPRLSVMPMTEPQLQRLLKYAGG